MCADLLILFVLIFFLAKIACDHVSLCHTVIFNIIKPTRPIQQTSPIK